MSETTWKLRIVGELEISSAPYPPDDDDAKTWLINDILLGDVNGLVLHSNEIGDEVGVVRISEVTEWTS